ncbi:MAG: DUF3489 domain-containing protein [Acidobacteriia bacterium]|nr:DUF3489 domain-containing protein [Terriglobia bacterium]
MTASIPEEETAKTKARVAKPRPHAAPTKAKPARKATHGKKPAPARRGTKTAKILDLLKRPGGVTLKELMKATGWQAHSVRGFLSGTLGKKMETPVESSKYADGERCYRVSSK